MKISRTIVVAAMVGTLLLAASYGQEQHSAAYHSAAKKFEWISENGKREHPSGSPTILTAPEWNAYLNEGGVKLPEGVSSVHISSQPAVVHGNAEVDFDRLTANRTRNNPLLALFTGKHHVTVTAQAAAARGVGMVRVESVEFDGVQVPTFALEYFCNRYLRPRYGNAIGMDSTFRLHSRIDSAIVGTDQASITQR